MNDNYVFNDWGRKGKAPAGGEVVLSLQRAHTDTTTHQCHSDTNTAFLQQTKPRLCPPSPSCLPCPRYVTLIILSG